LAALTLTVPTAAGVAWTPAAVSASDTISQSQLGTAGCWLVIINGGGSPDTVGRSDAGFTPAAGSAAAFTNSVTNGTSEVMFIPAKAADLSTGLVTITHSFTTSVTYVLLPAYAS
jgi:hypothetical protein